MNIITEYAVFERNCNPLYQLTSWYCDLRTKFIASFPGLSMPSFCHLQYENQEESLDRFIYHVMHATADVLFSLLTSGFVLSPSLFIP